MNKEKFIELFSQSFIERRFSLVPNPYADSGLYEDYGKCKKTTVGQFSKKFTKGTYFILVRGHAFTIKNGVVIGNQDDAIKLKRPIKQVFEIK